jgi:hypothetical protein
MIELENYSSGHARPFVCCFHSQVACLNRIFFTSSNLVLWKSSNLIQFDCLRLILSQYLIEAISHALVLQLHATQVTQGVNRYMA